MGSKDITVEDLINDLRRDLEECYYDSDVVYTFYRYLRKYLKGCEICSCQEVASKIDELLERLEKYGIEFRYRRLVQKCPERVFHIWRISTEVLKKDNELIAVIEEVCDGEKPREIIVKTPINVEENDECSFKIEF